MYLCVHTSWSLDLLIQHMFVAIPRILSAFLVHKGSCRFCAVLASGVNLLDIYSK